MLEAENGKKTFGGRERGDIGYWGVFVMLDLISGVFLFVLIGSFYDLMGAGGFWGVSFVVLSEILILEHVFSVSLIRD